MLITCHKSRFQNPHWYGFSEAPYTGMRSVIFHSDIAQRVEQQTGNLWVAGSIPALGTALTQPFFI